MPNNDYMSEAMAQKAWADSPAKTPYGLQQAALDQRETDIGSARAALSMARELSEYTRSIVDRLCGCVPETASDGAVGGKGLGYDPDGVLPSIGSDARRSMRAMSEAMSALRRLNDQIP